MSSVSVSIVLPSTRTDGSSLALGDIASYAVNKAAGSAPAAVLQNVSGPFTAASQSFTDTSPDAGQTDNYSVTVTDVEGNVSAAGNASVAIPPSQLAPPSAPSVSATYVP